MACQCARKQTSSVSRCSVKQIDIVDAAHGLLANDRGRALLMGAAWAINLAIAEWAIRKRLRRPARTAFTR